MKHIQILISLVALSFLGATATPAGNADVPPPTDRAISLSREAIPAGATVYGLDGNPLPTETDDEAYDAGPFSGIAKRDDCDGSSLCSKLPAGGGECPAASSAYVDDAWYCGYTSRVSSHCTAIFTCGTYHGTCWAGWFLKQQFQTTTSRCSGDQCGSTYFDTGNCRATYNYCASCDNVG